MTASNDPLPPGRELVGLTAQARFLIAALDHYALDPDAKGWALVVAAQNDVREYTDDIWTRYLKNKG